MTLAACLKHFCNFRTRAIPTQSASTPRIGNPPAFRTRSRISSLGVSQKSTVATAGPDKDHPSHSRISTLSASRFIRSEFSTGSSGRPYLITLIVVGW